MVIDNIDSADTLFSESVNGKTLAEIIPAAKQGRILYTSRNRDVAVDILHGGQPVEVGPLSPIEAHELLNINDCSRSNAEDMSILLQELEYIPLAIIQAAAYMSKSQKSAGQYLSLFRSSGSNKARLLAYEFNDHGRDVGSRESVAKTWMISFDHISAINPRAADMLSLMSCYDQQSIPPVLFRAEMDDLDFEEATGALLAFSLIRLSDSGATYSMHRLVQVTMATWLSIHGSKMQTNYMSRALDVLAAQYQIRRDPALSYAQRTHQFEAMHPHAEKVLAYRLLQPSAKDHSNRAFLLYRTGVYLYNHGRDQEADSRFKEARALGSEAPTLMLARIQIVRANYDAAKKLLQPYWESIMEGPDAMEQVDATEVLALTLLKHREYTLAKSVIEKCLSKVQGAGQSVDLYYRLGQIHHAQGNYAEAEQSYLRGMHAYEVQPATLTVRNFLSGVNRSGRVGWLLDSLTNLGHLLQDMGRLKEAESLFRTLVAICDEYYGSLGRRTNIVLFDLASVQEDIGNYESAGLMYQRAYRDSAEFYGPEHPQSLSYKKWLEDFGKKMEEKRRGHETVSRPTRPCNN